jgi:uncharacterized protein (DUF849 family)
MSVSRHYLRAERRADRSETAQRAGDAEQMAREARAAFNAGASIMHVHLRQQKPNKGHLRPGTSACKEIQQAIREVCRRHHQPPRASGRSIRARSTACAKNKIAACCAGSLNDLKLKSDNTWAWPPMMFDNAVEKVQDYLDVMKDAGAVPEFGCFDTASCAASACTCNRHVFSPARV